MIPPNRLCWYLPRSLFHWKSHIYTENDLCFIFYKVSYTAFDITKKNTGIMNTGPRGPCSILLHPALCPWNWLMWTTSKFPLCSGFWFGQSKGNTAGLRGLCKNKERLPFILLVPLRIPLWEVTSGVIRGSAGLFVGWPHPATPPACWLAPPPTAAHSPAGPIPHCRWPSGRRKLEDNRCRHYFQVLL